MGSSNCLTSTVGSKRTAKSRCNSIAYKTAFQSRREAAPPSALSNLFLSLARAHRTMVQPKNKNTTNKKPKPRRQRDGVKKHGKQTDIEELRVQLDALGLKIVEVTADGNCFFRALADQLHGNEDEHQKYREMVVKYIMDHREDFEPFIEDEVPFDEYCRTMEKDGTWAGNMELQAASLVTRRNICIHRLSSPRWYISNFSGHQDNMIHLCYHDGEHYNSVRLKEDSCEGPARPIIIKVDAHISRKDHNDKATTNKSSKGSSCRSLNRESVKLVMIGTGCKDVNKVEQVLQEVDDDVDVAIEFLIAEQDMDLSENADSSNDRPKGKDLVQGSSGEGQSQEPGLPEVASADLRLEQNEQQGKKDCSCKSKTKCQACSTSTGKTSPSVDNKRAFNKGKRETKQNKRKEARKQVKESGSGPLPDMGALCI